ncbi:MAG TPA: cytochrome c [Acidimicrobiales bacterium]|jgi:mono/diheme cytochrome c family protein|nr:cytochrome c [Acidimicrobiales bacterium]
MIAAIVNLLATAAGSGSNTSPAGAEATSGTAERIGIGIAIAVVVGFVAYAIVAIKNRDPQEPPGSEIELAPNRRPYYDDEALEGPRLERFLGWALVLLIICAVGPMIYWLNEPSRQAGAVENFRDKSIERGRQLFLPTDSPEHGAHFGCADCHGGMAAAGGVADYTLEEADGTLRRVKWAAPRLDTVLKKFSREEVRQILIYGRVNTPMPAWGVEGGGPMNAQQIDDLVNYIQSIQVSDAEAQRIAVEEASAEAKSSGLTTTSGETLFRTNCARCHTQGWAYGEPEEMGGGAFGPNLTNGAALRQFPDREDLIQFIQQGTKYGRPYGVRGMGGNEGGGMPGFGKQDADEADGQLATKGVLTQAQIEAIVDYVRGL